MRHFTQDHEWIELDANGESATVGITDYAQAQLGDIVFVELPAAGTKLSKGDEAAVVDSVKAAAEVYAPVSGVVSEGNPSLESDPALVNSSPEQDGWFFTIVLEDKAELDALMDETAYRQWVATL
jgi:glycine cleavage system H protein